MSSCSSLSEFALGEGTAPEGTVCVTGPAESRVSDALNPGSQNCCPSLSIEKTPVLLRLQRESEREEHGTHHSEGAELGVSRIVPLISE